MNRHITQAIAAIALISPLYGHADPLFRAESGTGVTSYETEEGRWYQDRMPYTMSTIRMEYSAGFTGAVTSRGKWGVDWHADFVNLGRATVSCQCDTSDADYKAGHTQHTALFSGSGRALGGAFTVEPYRWYGGVRIGVEAGAFVYHANWSESVTGWTVSDAPTQNFSLSSSGWHVAPVAGVSIGNGVWSLSYRHYFMRGATNHRLNVPPLWTDADVLEIKRRF